MSRAQDPGLQPAAAPLSSWSPLRHKSFRMLYSAWVGACLCMFMNDVGSAWLMTSLTTSPVMIALVQTAATLPIFLLGLPSGALADILDRRRLLIFTQSWGVVVASALFSTAITGHVTPVVLLLLVFANGLVLAIRWPAFSAIIPELVPMAEIPTASALSGIANNSSRIVGPLVAGLIIASAGVSWVFAFTAFVSAVSATVLISWSYSRKESALPGERIAGAIRVGIQHVRQTPVLQRVMTRVFAFFFNSIGLIALLPLVAKQLGGTDANTFTLLMSAMGAGAVAAALALPRASRRWAQDVRYAAGTLIFAAGAALAALAEHRPVAMLALFFSGGAWMVTANTLMVTATMALPDWVRARGLSIIQMAMMGASASGAAIWGYVAGLTGVPATLVLSAVAGPVVLVLTRKTRIGTGAPEDLAPAGGWEMPPIAMPVDPEHGPVLVMVEYRIDPARTDEFLELMRESRRVWLAHGLHSWSLFSDVAEEGRHVEHFIDESWASYLRRLERIAASYVPLRERKWAMHIGADTPTITRYIARKVG